MRGLRLRPGALVEIDIDIHHKSDVWYPATLIKQSNGTSFRVKYQVSRESGFQKLLVDSSHIRPSPSGAYRRSYNLRDRVDAFFDNGWWSGVVTQVFECKRYLVRLDRTQLEEELRLSDLRLHIDWSYSDGKWFQCIPSGGGENPSSSQSANLKEAEVVRKRKRGRSSRVVRNRKTKEPDAECDSRNEKAQATNTVLVRDVETETEVNDDGDRFVTEGGADMPAATDGSMTSSTVGHCNKPEETPNPDENQPDNPTEEKRTEELLNETTAPDTDVEKQTDMTSALSSEVTQTDIEDLPFVKISPVWKTIESMEIFAKIPQKPHFRPLYNHKEECREGLAIGNMITFVTLVGRVSTLQLWDPVSVIDGYMDALGNLESMGLEGGPVRERLKKLMAIRRREEMPVRAVGEMEDQVMEREREKLELREEIDEVERKMREVEEKKGGVVSTREMKDTEISVLELSKEGLIRGLKEIEDEFERVVGSFR